MTATFDASTLALDSVDPVRTAAHSLITAFDNYPGRTHQVMWLQAPGVGLAIEVSPFEVEVPPADEGDEPTIEVQHKLTRFGFIPPDAGEPPLLTEFADVDITSPDDFLASVGLA